MIFTYRCLYPGCRLEQEFDAAQAEAPRHNHGSAMVEMRIYKAVQGSWTKSLIGSGQYQSKTIGVE